MPSSFRFRPAWVAILAGGIVATSAVEAWAQKKTALPSPAPLSAPPARPLNLAGEVNDERVEEFLDISARRLIESGRTARMSDLIQQLTRRTCSVALPRLGSNRLSSAEMVARFRTGVVVIGDLYRCKKCPRWHVGASSGFMLNDSGVCVTCYHVVNIPESPTLIAMTGDGRVVAVKEVLAANPHTDVAILQLDGAGFTPLPLDLEAPIGAPVRVISHPDNHFFTLSEGIVSRYVGVPLEKKGGEVTMMAITADFGAGSSGAPVFNERGGVVGMVNNTQSLYYDPKRGRDLQMVFKHCLPSQYILQLIR